MSTGRENNIDPFRWKPQPDAALAVKVILDRVSARCEFAQRFGEALQSQTGSRLIDWIDHLAVPAAEAFAWRLSTCGFIPEEQSIDPIVLRHGVGLFPEIYIHSEPIWRVAIKVDSIEAFRRVHGAAGAGPIEGSPQGPFRRARIASEGEAEFWAVERHGRRGWDLAEVRPAAGEMAARHREAFQQRRRDFEDEQAGFEHAAQLIRRAVGDLGTGWTSDLFFAAERDYWMSRNRAAQVQKTRQDRLGLGWANHDHHTYRSSRQCFAALIAVLEEMGLECRERFYAGKEAGWGAQILEQPESGIVVFADVDLAPQEVSGDFAHTPLPPSDQSGTVGLWCRLHGEAFLGAGMHHLECRFDFAAARSQLQAAGIRSMPPFTETPHLKQAFTEGEIWPVAPGRINAALADAVISPEEADRFRSEGALGSHLEILERNNGYKGFNQAGINEIIRETDPRRRY